MGVGGAVQFVIAMSTKTWASLSTAFAKTLNIFEVRNLLEVSNMHKYLSQRQHSFHGSVCADETEGEMNILQSFHILYKRRLPSGLYLLVVPNVSGNCFLFLGSAPLLVSQMWEIFQCWMFCRVSWVRRGSGDSVLTVCGPQSTCLRSGGGELVENVNSLGPTQSYWIRIFWSGSYDVCVCVRACV